MTLEQPLSDVSQPSAPAWGAPQPRSGWSPKLTLAAVGIAALIAAVGGAAIYAATEGARNDFAAGMHGPGSPGGFGPPPGMAGPAAPGMGFPGGPPPGMPPPPPLHGQFVVPDGSGGYVTQLTQTGVLTAVSDKQITAKSADGFTQTYVLGPGSNIANDQLAVNDTVTVHATLIDNTATAFTVFEGQGGGPGGPPPGWPPPGHN